MNTKKTHKGGWQTKLKALLAKHNHMRANGKRITSNKTREERERALFQMFHLLRTLNFKIEDPANLKQKHIQALVDHWVEKKLSAGSIENNLTYIRTLCEWLGKSGMVLSSGKYADGIKRTYAAMHDKSFTGNGVDFWTVFVKILDKDLYVAMQLLVVKAFGLRRKEAVMFKPVIADRGFYIEAFKGTKTGKERTVLVDNEEKREILEILKAFVMAKKKNVGSHIGHPDGNLEQNMKHYSYILGAAGLTKKDLGVTGHGLRTEFVIDELLKRGVVVTVRGGTGLAASKVETQLARLQVSELVGHSRTAVLTAYSGKLSDIKKWNQENAEKQRVVLQTDPETTVTNDMDVQININQ